MARGFPKRNAPDIAPLKVKRLKNVPLASAFAFQMENEKDSRKGGKYIDVDKVLALNFDTGYPIRDTEGELVTDDEGHGQPHYIHHGYVKLSSHFKSNFVAILKGMGAPSEWFDDEGSLTDDIAETLEAEFGTNGLGDDYEGADWDDLPFYVLRSDGGEHDKRDVQVPVTSLKLGGYELLGRCVDMSITIDKNGYNRAEAFFPPEGVEDFDSPVEPTPSMSLGEASPSAKATAAKAKKAAPKRKASGMPKKGVPKDEVETAAVFGDSVDPENEPTPFEPEPTSKRAIYVTRALQTAGIPGKDRVAFLAWMLEDEGVTSVAEIELGAAQQFRAMAEGPDANGDSGAYLRRRYTEWQSVLRNPHLHGQDEGDEDFGDDDFDEGDDDF